MPWCRVSALHLPPAIQDTAYSLKGRRVSRPARAGSLFWVIRVGRLVRVPEVPFEQAQARLITMSRMRPLLIKSPVSRSEARTWYKRNLDSFRRPDTLLVRLWVAPVVRGKESPDTLRVGPASVALADLPAPLRDSLSARLGRGEAAARVVTPCGAAFARVEARLKGRGFKDFEEAAPSIVSRLQWKPIDLKGRSGPPRQRFLEDRFYADMVAARGGRTRKDADAWIAGKVRLDLR
jgi:hypothetical protein